MHTGFLYIHAIFGSSGLSHRRQKIKSICERQFLLDYSIQHRRKPTNLTANNCLKNCFVHFQFFVSLSTNLWKCFCLILHYLEKNKKTSKFGLQDFLFDAPNATSLGANIYWAKYCKIYPLYCRTMQKVFAWSFILISLDFGLETAQSITMTLGEEWVVALLW